MSSSAGDRFSSICEAARISPRAKDLVAQFTTELGIAEKQLAAAEKRIAELEAEIRFYEHVTAARPDIGAKP